MCRRSLLLVTLVGFLALSGHAPLPEDLKGVKKMLGAGIGDEETSFFRFLGGFDVSSVKIRGKKLSKEELKTSKLQK